MILTHQIFLRTTPLLEDPNTIAGHRHVVGSNAPRLINMPCAFSVSTMRTMFSSGPSSFLQVSRNAVIGSEITAGDFPVSCCRTICGPLPVARRQAGAASSTEYRWIDRESGTLNMAAEANAIGFVALAIVEPPTADRSGGHIPVVSPQATEHSTLSFCERGRSICAPQPAIASTVCQRQQRQPPEHRNDTWGQLIFSTLAFSLIVAYRPVSIIISHPAVGAIRFDQRAVDRA